MTGAWPIILSGIALVVITAFIFRRRLALWLGGIGANPGGHIVAVDAPQVAELIDTPGPLDNVITRLDFDESLDLETFAKASQEAAISDLNRRLASSTPDGLVIAVNGLQLVESGVNMVVSVSKDGQQMLQDGVAVISRNASQQGLPVLRSIKDGRILEMMKEARGAQAMAKLASLGAMAVGAAHIIAGADIAKRLKAVDAKIDLLLAYRKIDQMAVLERIYTSARELCTREVTKEKQWEMWKMRGELRELRIRWRRELRHEIELVKDPNQGPWFRNVFRWIEPVDKGPHRIVHERITESQPHLMLLEYSLRLDQTLAVASDTVREFETSLRDELRGLAELQSLLQSKAELISKKYHDLTVQPILDGMSAMLDGYGRLLPKEETTPLNL
jgi:hypothetical protein